MPTNQDIVLNLVAKLDQGNIQSEVQSLATSMTTAFESAFENLGQRLASQMLKAFQMGGQSSVAAFQQQAEQMSQGFDPLKIVPGGSMREQPPVVPPGPTTVAQAPQIPPTPVPAANPLAQFQGGFTAPAIDTAQQLAGLRPRIGQTLGRMGQDPFAFAELGYEDFGARFAEARSIVAARKSGVQVDMTQEQRGRLEGAQEDIKKAQEALVKEIFELNEAIKKNTEALKDAPEEQKAILREQVRSDTAAREESRRQTERLQEGQKDIGSALEKGSGGGMLGKIGGYALAAHQLGQAAVQIPGVMRGREVAIPGIENMAGRAAMSGDIEKLFAAQQLGGFGAIEQAAGYEQAARTGVAGLGIAGGAAMGAAAGTMFAGPAGTLAGGIVGAGVGGLNFIASALGYSQGQKSLMEERLGVERAKSPEFYEAMSRSRGLAMGGFEAARGMGIPEMAMLAAGGGAGIENLQSQQVQAQAAIAEEERLIQQNRRQMASGVGGLPRGLGRLGQLRENLAGIESRIAEGDPYSVDGRSLRSFAADYGVGPEQLSGVMARSMATMGGAFLGQTPELMQNMGGLAQMARLTGLGFGQAPELAGALVRGGESRGDAMEATRQMFEDAMAAGLDKARVGQAMMTTASRIEQLGMGGAQAAQQEQRMALAAAQAISGGGPIEGFQMEIGQRTVQQLREMGSAEGGLGMVGGYQAVRKFGGELQRKIRAAGGKMSGFSDVEQAALQSLEVDEAGLKELLRRKGVSEEVLGQLDLKEEAERITQMKAQEALGSLQTGTASSRKMGSGPLSAAEYALGKSQGEKGLSGVFAVGRAAESVRTGMRPVTQGITAEDINQYGFAGAEALAKERAQQQIETSVTGTEAGQMARQQAQIGALQAGAGMQTLDQQAAVLATAFEQLALRTNQLFAEKAKTTEEAKPARPMSERELNAFLGVGARSTQVPKGFSFNATGSSKAGAPRGGGK